MPRVSGKETDWFYRDEGDERDDAENPFIPFILVKFSVHTHFFEHGFNGSTGLRTDLKKLLIRFSSVRSVKSVFKKIHT